MTPLERSTKLANTVLDAAYGVNEATEKGSSQPPEPVLADHGSEAFCQPTPNKAAADYEGRGDDAHRLA